MSTDPLKGTLQGLSLNELLMLLEKLLPFEGFGDVETLGRRKSKQKSKYGGFELRCRVKLGNQSGTVLVKVVEKFPLRTRMVHEMAGCVLEHDAWLGIVVSPFNTKPSRTLRQALQPKLRVRTIEGTELTELMKCSGLGVRPGGDVDYAFFASLEAGSHLVHETIDHLKSTYLYAS